MTQTSDRFGEQIVEIPVPQVADQSGARFVVVPVPLRVFSVQPLGEGSMRGVVRFSSFWKFFPKKIFRDLRSEYYFVGRPRTGSVCLQAGPRRPRRS